MYALCKQVIEQFAADISPVGEHLSEQLLCENAPYTLVPVIHVCSCETECYYVSAVVTEQVKLESMAPPHGTLSICRKTCENLVEVPAHVVTHGNHRAVNKTDARTFTKGIKLHEEHHLEKHPRHEFYEPVV